MYMKEEEQIPNEAELVSHPFDFSSYFFKANPSENSLPPVLKVFFFDGYEKLS